jgi:hypothetical protein
MGESVTQKHDMACGLACVSFITGESYDQLAAQEPPARLNLMGYLCPELVKLLGAHGQQYAWKELPESERDGEFEIGDIVFVERSDSLPYGHFLAKTEHGWMDPWINLSKDRTDVAQAQSGFRETLPGRAEYLVYPVK